MIASLGLLGLLACGGGEAVDDTGAPVEALDPSLPGEWAAGTDVSETVGQTGVPLVVQAWYPLAEGEDPGAVHAYGDLVEGGARDGGVAACEQPRPVVVFSHGNQGMRWQSFFLTEHLASHGYVVVAPDHTGNTIFDKDPDRMPELVFRRPLDVADSFDHLLARAADPQDRLYGCVDPDAGYAVVGHSFGGFTSLVVAGAVLDPAQTAEWCATNGGWLCDEVAEYAAAHPEQATWDLSDPRAWAAVPMAPAAYETLFPGLPLIALPTLILAGSRDSLTPWEGEVGSIWEDLQAQPRAAAIIEDAGHYSFSDACTLVPTFEDCSEPFLAPEEVHALARTMVLAWLVQARGGAGMEPWLPPQDDHVEWLAP
ncbi:hypothetical protein L6R53_06720 [Myxococcota bacterium]|nr:hypothetical protein [Myxococcota bacterium]